MRGKFGTRSTSQLSKRLLSLEVVKDGEVLHSAVDKHPSLPPSPPICLLSALPPSPPPCPDHCPAHPSAHGQWLTFKEKQGKRGARCHRIACLLTESLKAAPHKSKRSIIGIVSPRATCPTKIPLLSSLFSLPAFFSFYLFGRESGQPSPCYMLLQPPTLDFIISFFFVGNPSAWISIIYHYAQLRPPPYLHAALSC